MNSYLLSKFYILFSAITFFSNSLDNDDSTVNNCAETFTVGYEYNFDTSEISDCWTVKEFPSNSSTTYYSLSDEVFRGETGNSIHLVDRSPTANAIILISPQLPDLSTDKKLEFYISTYEGDLIVGTVTDPETPESFTELSTIDGDVAYGEWERRSVYLNNYNGTDKYLAFKLQQTYSRRGEQVFIDDIKYVQSVDCIDPFDITVSSITDDSAQINWSGSGTELLWEFEYEILYVSNSTQRLLTYSPSIALNNLIEGTEYSIKIRSKCDTEALFSEWSDPIPFITACIPIEANYTESFEHSTGINPCWTTIVNNHNAFADIRTTESIEVNYQQSWGGAINETILPSSGNQFVYFYNGSDSPSASSSDFYLISKPILDIDNSKRIRFNLIVKRRFSSRFNESSLHIGTMTDPSNPDTFDLIETITPEQMSEVKLNGLPLAPWREHTVYLNELSENIEATYIAIQHGDEVYGTEFYLDDFKFENIPSCTEPLNSKVLHERFNEVDISWNSYSNSTSNLWEIVYGPDGFSLDTGQRVQSSAESVTLQDLLSNTSYDFYVRAKCNNDWSDWSFVNNFTTKCEGYLAGYSESFETQGEGLFENCWTAIRPTGSGSPYWDNSLNNISLVNNVGPNGYPANTGSNCVRIFNEIDYPTGGTPSDRIVLVSPRLADLDNYKKITFWLQPVSSVYASPNEVIIGTLSDPDDHTTFTPYHTITNAADNEDTYTKYEVTFSDYALTDKYIGFKQGPSNRRQVILFDDFNYSEVTCVTPTNLSAYQSEEGSVTLEWQDNNYQESPESWEIEYGPKDFVLGEGIITTSSTNPFQIDELSNGKYDYYVRAVCNDNLGYSNWSDSYSFAITCTLQAPFFENFDSYDAQEQHQSDGITDFCWERSNHDLAGIIDLQNLYAPIKSAPNTAFVNDFPTSDNSMPGMLVSPFLIDFDNNKTLRLWLRNETTGINTIGSGIIVGTMSNPLDRNTFQSYITIEADEIQTFGREFFIDFSGYAGTDKHIAIIHDQSYEYSLVMIDDFLYGSQSPCNIPLNINTKSIGTSSATIKWEMLNDNSTYELEYGPSGFAQGDGIIETTTNLSIDITNLQPDTEYDYYLRSQCNSNTASSPTTPLQFTTACSVESLPWVENFTEMDAYGEGTLPNCLKGEDNWVSSNQNLSAHLVGDGDSNFIYVTFDEYGLRTSLITPMFYLESGVTYKFKIKMKREVGDYSFHSVRVKIGMGSEHWLLDNNINYFSGFDFGFYEYFPVETTFTPVLSGEYSFGLYVGHSSIVNSIALDSFSLDTAYETSFPVEDGATTLFDFEEGLPFGIILESTEFSNSSLIIENDSNSAVKLSSKEGANPWKYTDNQEESWILNQDRISKVNFEINPSQASELLMKFKVNQTINETSSDSSLRVVVNGVVQDYIYSSGTNNYDDYEIDLSAFINQKIRISIQYLGKTPETHNNQNSVLIDDIVFKTTDSTLDTEALKFSNFTYYPNPAKNKLFIDSKEPIDSIELINMLGQVIIVHKGNVQQEVTLDVSDLSSSIYFMKVYTGTKHSTVKVIVK